ncbi:MAG: hypothetical protein K0S28_323 [Paucimonas sp.]|jgi:hypothetical protein|nr:hypothetical protein [Paucimonas sp.]
MRKFGPILLCLYVGGVSAAEGMWTLDNLPAQQIQSVYGFTPQKDWVDRVKRSSVRLAQGCSGSFVSPEGLVMTNHHCVRQCIEQLSTQKMDFTADGFLARRRSEELRCPEVELNRLEQITDITQQVTAATSGLEGAAYKQAKNAVDAKLTSECVGTQKETVRCDVVDLYHGGRYHLYKYHRFQDARLVWAPEDAVAFFGGDPDNFNFPRYNLDIALLRAYENGKPAAVTDYFPFSRNGATEGELTFVTGHPGRTQRQLTVSQLETLRDVTLLNRLLHLSELRGMLSQYGKRSAEASRISLNDLFSVENSYKAIYGQMQALLDPRLLQQKRTEEEALKRYVSGDKALSAKASGAWKDIEQVQISFREITTPYNVKELGRGFYSRYYTLARSLVRGADERVKANTERLPEFADARLPELEQQLFSSAPIYPDFEKAKLAWSLTKMREWLGADDLFVKEILGMQSPEQVAEALVSGTRLGDPAVRKALWQGGKAAVEKSNDPFIKLARQIDPAARAIRKRMESEVESVEKRNSQLIAQARFAQVGTSVYPDATFTLRLSYGDVRGWTYRGNSVTPFTTMGGAFARHTGAHPFALPPSWLAAKNRLNLQQPFNFVTTNDIIGGNSGSPVINRRAEVVGLIFDGNIHSLGGSFWFDENLNRSVAVHSGAILEALDKVYKAKHLADELRQGSR